MQFERTPLDHLADCEHLLRGFCKCREWDWGEWGIFVGILEVRVVCGSLICMERR